MVGRYKFLFISGALVVTTASAGFLTAEKFPTTINDVSFSDKVENSAAGYAPFKDADPYLQIQLQTLNDELADEVERIEKEHELYCMGAGANKPECMPYIPDRQTPPQTEQDQRPPVTAPQPGQDQQPPVTPPAPQPPPPGTYCENAHPYIPRNQILPLGVPISPNLDIYAKAQQGNVISGFEDARGGGHIHQGVDIGSGPKYFDSPVYAIADGVVSITKADFPQSTAGNYIAIKHADGFESKYMHLNSIMVSQGQRVQAGCQIGTIGHTGGSAGKKEQGKPFRLSKNATHLHYELHNTNKVKTMDTPRGPITLKYSSKYTGTAFDPLEALKYK